MPIQKPPVPTESVSQAFQWAREGQVALRRALGLACRDMYAEPWTGLWLLHDRQRRANPEISLSELLGSALGAYALAIAEGRPVNRTFEYRMNTPLEHRHLPDGISEELAQAVITQDPEVVATFVGHANLRDQREAASCALSWHANEALSYYLKEQLGAQQPAAN